MCWQCALALTVDPYRSCACQAASPAKDKDAGASGFAPEASGSPPGLPLHSLWLPSSCRPASGANPQPKVRTPVLERHPESSLSPSEAAWCASERVRGRRQQTFGAGAGAREGTPQHPAARTQEKKKARENRGLIKAKTQDHPLGSTNNPRQDFARNKQAPNRNYNEKKSPLRVIVRVLEGGVQRGLRFLRTHTACAKVHHAQPGTSCPDFS